MGILKGTLLPTSTHRKKTRNLLLNMPSSKFLSLVGTALLEEVSPKRIVLSGPSGFLGSRVLESILQVTLFICALNLKILKFIVWYEILKVHEHRTANGMEPGEVILLSYSPGNLMSRLVKKIGKARIRTIRASRVDYYVQHEVGECLCSPTCIMNY